MATSDLELPSTLSDLTLARQSFASWGRSGEPWIWLTASAVGLSLVVVIGLLGLLAVKGLSHFWPKDVYLVEHHDEFGKYQIFGEIAETETITREQFLESTLKSSADVPAELKRFQFKTGNRRVNPPDFRWIYAHNIDAQTVPDDVVVVERQEWGNAYARLIAIEEEGEVINTGDLWVAYQARIDRVSHIRDERAEFQASDINAINYELEQLRLEKRRRELTNHTEFGDIVTAERDLQARYAVIEQEIRAKNEALARDLALFETADGTPLAIPMSEIVKSWRPNTMSGLGKLGSYLNNLWRFLSDEPREANTEGGIYPALFGTVLMVLLMSVFVTPFGVIAAVYLREYAKQGPLVRLVRIAVNNLAGVPSIVYGVFGLGFFVYLVGGSLDDLFFPEAKPAPTFGTPGLLWASLTLALLTVPVVIVSTEEGLTRIPKETREGSLALGATKAETLFKVVLPIASPSILTGMILAVARAAGEVAPLMLVGVVKLAPTLPVDGNFPFLHLERKFMHLGFHIYDVGFQSPNVDAARPLVYATALLLVVIIVVLNLTAITLRNHLESRFRLTA